MFCEQNIRQLQKNGKRHLGNRAVHVVNAAELTRPRQSDAEFLRQRVETNYLTGALLIPEQHAVPFLQDAFGTFAFSAAEWFVLFGVAASVVPVLEATKWMVRRGWCGEMD